MLTCGELTLFGQIPSCSQSHSSRNDCYLHQWVAVLHQPADGSVSCFVVGDGTFLFEGHYLVFLLQAAYYPIDSIEEVLLTDGRAIFTCGYKCRLVAHVGDVGTRESGCLPCKKVFVEVLVEFKRTQVYFEYLFSFVYVGQIDVYLSVEASCPQQCLVENICSVGGSEYDDTRIGAEAVHFGEQLVEGVFAFVVDVHIGVSASGTSYGVYLVDEDDTRSTCFCPLEEVAYAACSYTDEHLYEVAACKRKERYFGFACHCLCQQSLTCPRRTDEQSSLGYLATKLGVFLRVLQE